MLWSGDDLRDPRGTPCDEPAQAVFPVSIALVRPGTFGTLLAMCPDEAVSPASVWNVLGLEK